MKNDDYLQCQKDVNGSLMQTFLKQALGGVRLQCQLVFSSYRQLTLRNEELLLVIELVV